MKLSKHKLPTPDLELLITNLKAFIVKVEEDKENQEYDMYSMESCVYAKTLNKEWDEDGVSQILLGKDFYDEYYYGLKHTESKLYQSACKLFNFDYFEDNDDCTTKQQWLEVANKVVLKLEKKLWKRKVKEGAKALEDGVYRLDDLCGGYVRVNDVYGQRQSVQLIK